MQKRAEKRKYHYIYKITRIDGKYYIGMHSTDNLEDGYFGSGKRITRSIKKHGIEKHQKQILEFLNSRLELKKREEELITEEIRNDPLCMNIAPGGGGGFINKEHQQKCSSAGGKKTWMKSFHLLHTPESIEKRTQILKDAGHYEMSLSRARKSANSKASIEKRKKTLKERLHQTGEKNSQFGTCWVTNGVKPIKIKKEQLDEYLANGYSRGRNFNNRR